MDSEANTDTNNNQNWIELRWVVPQKMIEMASAFLFSLGAEGVQEDYVEGQSPKPRQPWDTGPLPEEPKEKVLVSWWNGKQSQDLRQNWQRYLEEHHLHEQLQNPPSFLPYLPEDWSQKWTDHFERHEISTNLVIAPPWLAQSGDVIVEPGIAFGTGEHPTTYSCLEALATWVGEDASLHNQSCLDVGCGSGILAIAAAHLGMNAYGIDIEEDAIAAAYKNAEVNSLSSKVCFENCDIKHVEGIYPVTVANLYAEVLVLLCDDILRLSSAKIALAGILVEKEHLVQDVFAPHCVQIRRKEEGDWVSLWFEKKDQEKSR